MLASLYLLLSLLSQRCHPAAAGVIVYEDSALVKSVQHGRVLVIDEADKAPVEVLSRFFIRARPFVRCWNHSKDWLKMVRWHCRMVVAS